MERTEISINELNLNPINFWNDALLLDLPGEKWRRENLIQ